MIILSVLFSSLSVCTMSYLAMTTPLGPWVAPIFVVVCMTFAIFFVNKSWFNEHAVVTIAAGSMGGMIGMCLGMSVPLFYVLQRAWFDRLLEQPILFFFGVIFFVFIVSLYALFFSYFLRSYFLSQSKSLFPISQLVYDMLFVNVGKKSHVFMLIGLGLASLWNGILLFIPASFVLLVTVIHMAPLLFSLGFIAGNFIIVPTLLGLFVRLVVIHIVKQCIPVSVIHPTAFLTIFSFGMILVMLCRLVYGYIKEKPQNTVINNSKPLFHISIKKTLGLMILFFIIISKIFAWYFNCALIIPFLVFMLTPWLLKYVTQIYSELGVVDISSFAWFVILPIIYFFHTELLPVIIVFSFAIFCFGLAIDSLFSYKLADLASVSFSKIVKYQVIGCIAAAISVAIFLYYFAITTHFAGVAMLKDNVAEMFVMAAFTKYDLYILLAGFVSGWCVLFFTPDLLIVVGATLTSPVVAGILSVAAIISDFTVKPKRWYPLWFGVYAGHMVWLIVQSVK